MTEDTPPNDDEEQLEADDLPEDVLLKGDVAKELTALRRFAYRLADVDDVEETDLFSAVDQAIDRVEDLEDRLDDIERKADTSLGLARQIDDGARADGAALSKKDKALHLSRDEVIRKTADSGNTGPRGVGGKRERTVGSVTNTEIQQMARPETSLRWQSVDDAWRDLEETWRCFEVDDSGETKKLTLTGREDVPDELVGVVEESLERDDLAKGLVGGGEE